MKKKILLSLLVIISLFIFTGCDKKKEDNKGTITIKDSTLKYTTTFTYDKNDGFEFLEKVTGGKYSEIEFKNEKENMLFDMYYSESSDDNAKKIKQNRKENQKNFKEMKFGEYDGYIYSNYADDLYIVITLKEDTKEHKVVELFTSVETINYSNDAIVYEMFDESKVVKKFFKSIKNTVE